MEKTIISDDIKYQLDQNRMIIYGNFFYKKSPNSEKKMEHLNVASKNFTQDSYCLAESLLYYGNLETYIGFAMQHYEEYHTVKTLRLQKNVTCREDIIRKLVSAIIDLRNNGFIYTDIHSRNILVNNSNIKLADMDHVTEIINSKSKDLLDSIWCLMNFIIDLYFYDNLVQDIYVFDRFMFGWDGVAGSGILTKNVEDCLTKAVSSDDSILSYDLQEIVELVIKEFQDQEKVKAIKKRCGLP